MTNPPLSGWEGGGFACGVTGDKRLVSADGEIEFDAGDVKVDEGLLAFRGEEEVAIGLCIHKHILCEDCRARGVGQQVEIRLYVGVFVGPVHPEAVVRDMDLGGDVEGGGEGIGPGVATGGVGAPAAGGEPAVATAGGVAVDGDEEDVVFAQLAAALVYSTAALGQGDVRFIANAATCSVHQFTWEGD